MSTPHNFYENRPPQSTVELRSTATFNEKNPQAYQEFRAHQSNFEMRPAQIYGEIRPD